MTQIEFQRKLAEAKRHGDYVSRRELINLAVKKGLTSKTLGAMMKKPSCIIRRHFSGNLPMRFSEWLTYARQLNNLS